MNFQPVCKAARVMHALSQPLPLDLPRRGYSVHFARSTRLGRHVSLPDSLAQKVLVWADTDPRVLSYSLGGPTWTYQNSKGQADSTSPFITVRMAGNASSYWDFRWSRTSSATSKSCAAKAAHSAAEGFGYKVFAPGDFHVNLVEHDNRVIAQKLLYDGLGVDTAALEAKVLMELTSPRTVLELGARLSLSHTRTTFIVLRLWLRGLAHLPMTTERIQPLWLVRRSGHGL